MSRGYTTPQPLSAAAAQSIYDRIAEYDEQIDKAKAEVDKATAQIAQCIASVHDVFQKRTELAMELARVAPESWTPIFKQRVFGFASAPYPGGRFVRDKPFPYYYGPKTVVTATEVAERTSPFPPAPSTDGDPFK